MEQLAADPSSRLCTSLNGWSYPISLEAVVLADLFDLTHAAHSRKRRPKPHPIRPWKSKSRERYGNTGGRSRDEIKAILARARDEGLT